MTNDDKNIPDEPGPESTHRSILIVVTVVMVILPLVLGALRLLGKI